MADLLGVELARPGTWPAATGKTEFTVQHLLDAADFFTHTGGQAVPISLGHHDDRFSGEPSFGSLTNVRFVEDDKGPVLLGDVVDMPTWLSAAAPKRWPNRSIEGWENFEYDGRTYRMVLTGLALLGVAPPAVRNIKSLRDLQQALAASAARRIVATAPDADPDPPPPDQNPPAPDDPGAFSYPQEGAGRMDPAKIREALGLAADASDDEVLEEARRRSAPSNPPTDPAPNPAPQPAPTPDPQPAPSEPQPAKPELVHASGTITIDASAWQEREDRIKRLEASAARQARDERDKVIAQAVTDGKFPPARREHWVRLWDADPEGTRQVLNGLARNVVPVMASGYDGDNDSGIDDEFKHLFPTEYTGRKGGLSRG